MNGDCAICEKHRGRGMLVGPVLYEDPVVVVSHRPAWSAVGRRGSGALAARPAAWAGRIYPGYLFVETRRHVPNLQSLTEGEAIAVARTTWVAARALEDELAPRHVFTATVGMSVEHFHQHVFVRPVGTPDDVVWSDVESWAEAPHVDDAELDDLCARLRPYFADYLT